MFVDSPFCFYWAQIRLPAGNYLVPGDRKILPLADRWSLPAPGDDGLKEQSESMSFAHGQQQSCWTPRFVSWERVWSNCLSLRGAARRRGNPPRGEDEVTTIGAGRLLRPSRPRNDITKDVVGRSVDPLSWQDHAASPLAIKFSSLCHREERSDDAPKRTG